MPQKLYIQLSHLGLILYCLSAGLSIGVSQTVVILTIALSIYFVLWGKKDKQISKKDKSRLFLYYKPILLFIFIALVSAILGVDTGKAISETLKTSLYLLLPATIFYSLSLVQEVSNTLVIKRIKTYFIFLCVGQAIASVHSLIENAFGIHIKPKIPGAVTESGQLVLVIPLALGLFLLSFFKENQQIKNFISLNSSLIKMGFVFLLLIIFVWPNAGKIGSSDPYEPVRFIALGLLGITLTFTRKNELKSYLIMLLFAALIVNLKRGPWAAVCLEVLIISLLLSKRLLILLIAAIGSLLIIFSPVSERIFSSENDFLISGGRKNMWLIGMDLAEKYPFGIGLDNADYIQVVDPSLPDSHRHLHNNFLNITVETGTLGLIFYIWWMGGFILLGFLIWKHLKDKPGFVKEHMAVFALSASLAILGWQAAGLVEYNFGDGEVRLIGFFLMGILLSLGRLSGVRR